MPENTVTIDLEYYDQLVMALEHLTNIECLALEDITIGWNGKPKLDMDAAEEYIKVLCRGRIKMAVERLNEEKAKKEAENNDAV